MINFLTKQVTKIRKALRVVDDYKAAELRIKTVNNQLADITAKLKNEKIAAKLKNNGIETRLLLKLETLQSVQNQLSSNSLLVRILLKLHIL